MSSANTPLLLSRLNDGRDRDDRDAAWTEFIALHNETLLRVCRTLAHDRDGAMDAYAFVLERLREDDFRRLRGFNARSDARFESWLVVVCRRLVMDWYRVRYGRPRSTNRERADDHRRRRRLEDLVGEAIDPDELSAEGSDQQGADASLRRVELRHALGAALSELSPSDRLLLALRFEDDRPMREITQVLGFASVFHGYRRLGAVLNTLRSALKRRGVEESDP